MPVAPGKVVELPHSHLPGWGRACIALRRTPPAASSSPLPSSSPQRWRRILLQATPPCSLHGDPDGGEGGSPHEMWAPKETWPGNWGTWEGESGCGTTPTPPTSGLRSRASGPDCPQVPGSASSLRQSRGGGQWRELPPVPGLSGGCLALLPPQHHHLPSQLKGGPLKGCYLRGNVHPPLAAWGPLPDTSSGAPTHPHRRAIVLQAGKEPPSPLASGHNRKCVWGPSLRTNSRPTETASGQRALAPAWE